MLWAPSARYVSQEARSAFGRDAVDQQELRRTSSTKVLIATAAPASGTSGPHSGRSSSRRGNENRLFNNAQISPVLDSEGSKSMSRLPSSSPNEFDRSRLESSPSRAAGIEHRAMMTRSMSRLPIAAIPAANESSPKSSDRSSNSLRAPVRLVSAPMATSSSVKDLGPRSSPYSRPESSPSARMPMRQVSAPVPPAENGGKTAKLRDDKEALLKKLRNQIDRLSQDRASASTPNSARDSCTPRVRLRSRCPNLEGLLAQKDIDAMQQWYTAVEAPLSYAFLDARCPYRWLDSEKHRLEDNDSLSNLENSWTFSDFKKEWDHPDYSDFGAWCDDHTTRTDGVDGASSTRSHTFHSARQRMRDESQLPEGSGGKKNSIDDAKLSARSPLKISEAASPQRSGLQVSRLAKRHQLHV